MANPAIGLLAFAGALSIAALQAWTIAVDTGAPRAPTTIAFTHTAKVPLIAGTKSAYAAPTGRVGVAEEIVITGTIDGSISDRILIKALRSMQVIAAEDTLPDIEALEIAQRH
jgi:hypothetical protein